VEGRGKKSPKHFLHIGIKEKIIIIKDPSLPPAAYVALSKWLNLSVPVFTHLYTYFM
jgi:hypothetical protein